MSNTAISIENVSKMYRLGQVGTGTLSHDMKRWWYKARGLEDPYKLIGEENRRDRKGGDYVWALEDISFDVVEGQVLGIIGKNGAGKSTLLKLLSRVTAPTKGQIKARGRIASLLEVGTGFHPELSGRENIFLNGAILGMTKPEIKKKFDEIVDFAGVERYIETPVKRYSSGMYVRLAFAVAAHLDPEILIVDEVLAVGDAEFQKKCLGRMKDVSVNEGRTVLFVSHNMAAVKKLCNYGVVLENGRMSFNGGAIEAVNYYQTNQNTESYFKHNGPINKAPGNENVRILKMGVVPKKGDIISISSGIEFEFEFYNNKEDANIDVTFELRTSDEIPVWHNGTMLATNKDSKKGIYTVKGVMPEYILNAGTYKVCVIIGENQKFVLYNVDDFVQFEVMNEVAGSNSNILPGVLRLNIPYDVSFRPE